MRVRMKVSDLITILTEVSKRKRMEVCLKYGFQDEKKAALQRALKSGRWVLA